MKLQLNSEFGTLGFSVLRKGLSLFHVSQVIPQLSCPVALFTYYNPILRRGIENYMTIIKNAGVHGTLPFSSFSLYVKRLCSSVSGISFYTICSWSLSYLH